MTSGGGGGIIIDITCAGRWERPAKIQTNGRNRYDEKEDFCARAGAGHGAGTCAGDGAGGQRAGGRDHLQDRNGGGGHGERMGH